ncbi:hypothetical protein V1509DRAFT_413394 [Lipomyces kononenkoae]
MMAFIPKALAIVSITIMSLSSSASACLELYGDVGYDQNSVAYGSLAAVDNGVQTCIGLIGSGDGNVDCIAGYSLNYDYTDNSPTGPLPVSYCNPSNCFQSIEIPLTCKGQYGDPIDPGPVCNFDYFTFGC